MTRSVAALVSCYCLVIVAAIIVLGLGAFAGCIVPLKGIEHTFETLQGLLHHPK